MILLVSIIRPFRTSFLPSLLMGGSGRVPVPAADVRCRVPCQRTYRICPVGLHRTRLGGRLLGGTSEQFVYRRYGWDSGEAGCIQT